MSTVTVHKYKCPLCGITYEDERLVRAHISLSTDAEHANRNGVMEDVEAVDSDDGVVETHTGHGTIADANMDEDVSAEAFPVSATDEQLKIFQTAVRNANVDSIAEIERRTKEMYEDLDVSYQTVRRTVKDFFVTDENDTEDDNFESLTPKQQAIVDYMATHPDDSYRKVADKVGTSGAYPARVEEDYEPIIGQRSEELAMLESPSPWTDDMESVVDELSKEQDPLNPARSYVDLAEEAGTQPNVVAEILLAFDDQLERRVSSANPRKTGTSGMSASPDFSPTVGQVDEQPDDEDNDQEEHVTEGGGDVHEKVRVVLDKVKSHRRTAETKLEYTDSESAVGTLALAKEVESDLEDVLNQSSV